jgi:hypothetical protein
MDNFAPRTPNPPIARCKKQSNYGKEWTAAGPSGGIAEDITYFCCIVDFCCSVEKQCGRLPPRGGYAKAGSEIQRLGDPGWPA